MLQRWLVRRLVRRLCGLVVVRVHLQRGVQRRVGEVGVVVVDHGRGGGDEAVVAIISGEKTCRPSALAVRVCTAVTCPSKALSGTFSASHSPFSPLFAATVSPGDPDMHLHENHPVYTQSSTPGSSSSCGLSRTPSLDLRDRCVAHTPSAEHSNNGQLANVTDVSMCASCAETGVCRWPATLVGGDSPRRTCMATLHRLCLARMPREIATDPLLDRPF